MFIFRNISYEVRKSMQPRVTGTMKSNLTNRQCTLDTHMKNDEMRIADKMNYDLIPRETNSNLTKYVLPTPAIFNFAST